MIPIFGHPLKSKGLMNLETVFSILHIEDKYLPLLSPDWEQSVASFAFQSNDYLTFSQISQNRQWCQVEDDVDPLLQSIITQIENKRELALLTWHCFQTLSKYPNSESLIRWPKLEAVFEEHCGVFYLLVALAAIPLIKKVHQQIDIPEKITQETCFQLKCFCDNHRIAQNGKPGILMQQFFWLRHYIDGVLFRIGRLEYRLWDWPGEVEVYRNISTKKTIALIADGTRLNLEGFVAFDDDQNTISATLIESEQLIRGFPVSPRGFVILKETALQRKEWQKVLSKGQIYLDMHIPAGGGMTLERCFQSMIHSFDFFKTYFPEQHPAAIGCISWIFNTQLETGLPNSNLANLMKELYLFPVVSSGKDGIFFVFYKDYHELTFTPKKTRLQKALLGVLESGKKLRSGGMFILKEDLDEFGKQIYRKEASSKTQEAGKTTSRNFTVSN
jgi:hypothetical protein